MGWYGFGETTYEMHVTHHASGRYVVTDDDDHLVWYRGRWGRIGVALMGIFDGTILEKDVDPVKFARWCPPDLVAERYRSVDPYGDAAAPEHDRWAEYDEELQFIRAWLAAGNRFETRL